MSGDGKSKDLWDKADVILKVIITLVVALVGILGQQYLSSLSEESNRHRLHTELLVRREEAETSLKRDVFNTIYGSFLSQSSNNPADRLLALELLAYNFHESVNLEPLFRHLADQFVAGKNDILLQRLTKAAREMGKRQLLVLDQSGVSADATLEFTGLIPGRGDGIPITISRQLDLGGWHRTIDLTFSEVDTAAKDFSVYLNVTSTTTGNKTVPSVSVGFSINFFDFPRIDNIRLSGDQRLAIVMNEFFDTNADFTIVLFPGSLASVSDGPTVEEAIERLGMEPGQDQRE
jgi:hypothetical protein